jgi:hypothetical protein
MVRNDITVRRVACLRKMKKNNGLGSNKKLMHLDETLSHLTYIHSKCWHGSNTKDVMKNDSTGQQWIVVYTLIRRGVSSSDIPDF